MTMIKILLIVAAIALMVFSLRGRRSSRSSAYVKIGMAGFLTFCAYAVIRPEDVSWVAAQLGVGRGTDLVLYLLVVGFGFLAIGTYLRFKDLEAKFAKLARAMALIEADARAAPSAPHEPAPVRRPDELPANSGHAPTVGT